MGRGKMLITTFMSNLDFGPARRVIAAYSDFRDPAERCQSFVTPLATAWRKVLRVRRLRSGPKFCESAGSGPAQSFASPLAPGVHGWKQPAANTAKQKASRSRPGS